MLHSSLVYHKEIDKPLSTAKNARSAAAEAIFWLEWVDFTRNVDFSAGDRDFAKTFTNTVDFRFGVSRIATSLPTQNVLQLSKYGVLTMAENGPSPRQLGWYYAMAQVGLEMVVPVGLGWWLDSVFGTQPWILVVGVVLGLALGIIHLVALSNRPPPENRSP